MLRERPSVHASTTSDCFNPTVHASEVWTVYTEWNPKNSRPWLAFLQTWIMARFCQYRTPSKLLFSPKRNIREGSPKDAFVLWFSSVLTASVHLLPPKNRRHFFQTRHAWKSEINIKDLAKEHLLLLLPQLQILHPRISVKLFKHLNLEKEKTLKNQT